jgi:hypothetical protein
MDILKFDSKEFEEVLDLSDPNLENYIDLSYKSLLFLGNSINTTEDERMKECAIFNIRLCYTYYLLKENYGKLSQIVELVKDIQNYNKSVEVDDKIIDEIVINLN